MCKRGKLCMYTHLRIDNHKPKYDLQTGKLLRSVDTSYKSYLKKEWLRSHPDFQYEEDDKMRQLWYNFKLELKLNSNSIIRSMKTLWFPGAALDTILIPSTVSFGVSVNRCQLLLTIKSCTFFVLLRVIMLIKLRKR